MTAAYGSIETQRRAPPIPSRTIDADIALVHMVEEGVREKLRARPSIRRKRPAPAGTGLNRIGTAKPPAMAGLGACTAITILCAVHELVEAVLMRRQRSERRSRDRVRCRAPKCRGAWRIEGRPLSLGTLHCRDDRTSIGDRTSPRLAGLHMHPALSFGSSLTGVSPAS